MAAALHRRQLGSVKDTENSGRPWIALQPSARVCRGGLPGLAWLLKVREMLAGTGLRSSSRAALLSAEHRGQVS